MWIKVSLVITLFLSTYQLSAQDISLNKRYIGIGYFGNVAEIDPIINIYQAEPHSQVTTQEGVEVNYSLCHNNRFESSFFLGFVQYKSNFLLNDYRWPSETTSGVYIPDSNLPNEIYSELMIRSASFAYRFRYYISPKLKGFNISIGSRMLMPLKAERLLKQQVVEKPEGSRIKNLTETIFNVKSEIRSVIPSIQGMLGYKIVYKKLYADLDFGFYLERSQHKSVSELHLNRSVQVTIGMVFS